MISFNGGRPGKDGKISENAKSGMITTIIHEVGHNYFPMIVNSDERQWSWMDEGINTFLQYLAEQEWEENYPSERGEPAAITPYMLSGAQVPIMTGSESILQFGENAYAKPATALNILRETVLGRELFDYAFKEYSRRWMFKRPMPALCRGACRTGQRKLRFRLRFFLLSRTLQAGAKRADRFFDDHSVACPVFASR